MNAIQFVKYDFSSSFEETGSIVSTAYIALGVSKEAMASCETPMFLLSIYHTKRSLWVWVWA
jgi:hypothetical protein